MPLLGGVSGNREADLITEVNIWNRQTKLGKVFSSSTIFRLPKGGDRAAPAFGRPRSARLCLIALLMWLG